MNGAYEEIPVYFSAGKAKQKSNDCFFVLPIRPIFIPERARARRADWAPGPGVLVLKSKFTLCQ